jgi:oxalate decarboxylase
MVPQRYDFRPSQMKPTKVTRGGEVKIVDSKVFPATPISAAMVRLKPGGLRELHWHPNADEWQYYVSGKGRMTVFIGDTRARTIDFQEGDVGYVLQSTPHYIENRGNTDLVFLEVFKSAHYQDISLGEWMAHTPHLLMNQHLHVGSAMLDAIPKEEIRSAILSGWPRKRTGRTLDLAPISFIDGNMMLVQSASRGPLQGNFRLDVGPFGTDFRRAGLS